MIDFVALAEELVAAWNGVPMHQGHAGICAETASDVLHPDLNKHVVMVDPRCWCCLARMAEDGEPLMVSRELTLDSDDKADLVAVLRRRLSVLS